MADTSSFDIVSKVDRQEVDNALNQTAKELAQRFDFRGTNADIAWAGDEGVTLKADTEDRVKAALEVFKEKLVKRQISLKSLDAGEPQTSGKGVQDRLQDRPGHRLGQGQGDQQEDPRRGPEGRAGADPGRPAARTGQEAGRPAGRDRAAQGRPTSTSPCSSRTTAEADQDRRNCPPVEGWERSQSTTPAPLRRS